MTMFLVILYVDLKGGLPTIPSPPKESPTESLDREVQAEGWRAEGASTLPFKETKAFERMVFLIGSVKKCLEVLLGGFEVLKFRFV